MQQSDTKNTLNIEKRRKEEETLIKDKLLVHQAIRGSKNAFAQLYKDIYRDLYRFALYTLRSSYDAEDVVSETVTDAWAQIRRLKNEESFKAWMFKILSNKCKQKIKTYASLPVELTEEIFAQKDNLEEDAAVRAAFAKLDDEERLVLSMKIFGGYKSYEIGEILELNENTVRSKQKRALDKMAEFLQ